MRLKSGQVEKVTGMSVIRPVYDQPVPAMIQAVGTCSLRP